MLDKPYIGQRVQTRKYYSEPGIPLKPGTVIFADFGGVCVEFDEPFAKGHDGHLLNSFAGKDGHCWWFHPGDLDDAAPTVRIYADGKRTIAKTGKDAQYHTTCIDGDTYDYSIGAIIALCRALHVDPAETCLKVLGAFNLKYVNDTEFFSALESPAEESKPTPRSGEGLYLTIEPTGGMALLAKMLDLEDSLKDEKYGGVGERTPYKATDDGVALCVGDLVEVTSPSGRKCPTSFVVKDEGGPFIDGIKLACNPTTGEIKTGWRVTRIRPWYEVPLGENFNSMKMCKES